MDTKKPSNKSTPHNSAGNTPEFKATAVEDKKQREALALQKAIKTRDERISMFASSHNFLAKNADSVEVQLEEFYLAENDIEAAIAEKT